MSRPTGDELTQRMPKYKNAIKWMWRLFILGILGVMATFVILSFSDLPTVEQLENPKSELATEVFSSDGKVLGRYYVENRVPVEFSDLSPEVVKALIATEDERFFNHSGIDFRALGRAAIKPLLTGGQSAGGGSTITQQLAKLLFTGVRSRNFLSAITQKLKEWIISLRLEQRYTKKEILAMYLNKFDFLYDSDGIKAASETYFGKDQKDLNVEEAAVLVGMLKNPSLYNPKKFPKNAIARRNVVFGQMLKNDLLTQEAVDTLKELPLNMSNFKRSNHAQGLAPYFRMELAKDLKFDILKREECLKPDGSRYDIYRDGLKIYTTIDAKMQGIAEEVMMKHMSSVQEKFWNSWTKQKLDPWTHTTESETEVPVEVRQKSLRKIIESSDRYARLHAKNMTPSLQLLDKEITNVGLKDKEIKLLLEEDKKKGALSAAIRQKKVKQERAGKLRRVLESENWSDVKSSWKKFQNGVDRIFDKKVKMKVFDYNSEKLEKDTLMSPLDSIRYHRMHLQTGILAVEAATGAVKVWVGGINHKYFQFDHIRTQRQVGSTFKPFVYATAINLQGISPCFTVYDTPQTIAPGEGNFHLEEPWTPRNAREEYSGKLLTLYEGLRKSINTVSVYLMKQLGDARHVITTVRQMGITSGVPPAPSIALGSCDLQVFEMAGAYTTFANNGVANKPIYITRIEDKNGKVLYRQLPEERQGLSPNANYVMVDMLQKNLTNARGFHDIKSLVGGKTGTTNDYSDGWFMGITPNLVIGTWVGGEDRWIHFRTLENGQGGRMARPFFANFVRELEKAEDVDYDPAATFFRPPGELGIEIDCSTYTNTPAENDEYQNEDLLNDDFGDDGFGDDGFDEPDSTKSDDVDEDF